MPHERIVNVGLSLLGKFVSLARSSAGCVPVALVVIMCVSETIEFMETTETALALTGLVRRGVRRSSKILCDVTWEGMCDPHGFFALYVYAHGGPGPQTLICTHGPPSRENEFFLHMHILREAEDGI